MKEASGSFLKKRTKKLFRLWAGTAKNAAEPVGWVSEA
jgi:hypothetical protein